MTSSGSLLDHQHSWLTTSLLDLARICDQLNLDPAKAAQLRVLAQHLLPTLVTSPSPLSLTGPTPLEDALELVSQARSAMHILVQGGQRDHELTENLPAVLGEVEQLIGGEIRRTAAPKMRGLYVIIDPEVTSGRDPADIARAALQGGAQVLQLRDKLREKGETLVLARTLKQMCVDFEAMLIINDHADLASVVNADGLHVGQGDLPVEEARKILKPWQVIGRSNHRTAELKESQAQGADHVAFGAVYSTSTKVSKGTSVPVGPKALKEAKAAVQVPVVAIGGINEGNVEPVVQAGADAICVTGAIGLADDPEDASRRLVRLIRETGGKG